MALDLKYGNIEIPGIEADEPVFILRAKDIFAEKAISEYQTLYATHMEAVVDPTDTDEVEKAEAFITGLRKVRNVFVSWQGTHAGIVRVPD